MFPIRTNSAKVRGSTLALAVILLGFIGFASPSSAGIYTDAAAWTKAIGKNTGTAFDFVKADPKLPNVLIIGNSISIGETPYIRTSLKGKANVYRIPENGGQTQRFIDKSKTWLDDVKWSYIIFNFGLHDLKYVDAAGNYDLVKGTQVCPVATCYPTNLKKVITTLVGTKAKLVWVNTTPVPNPSDGRKSTDPPLYNAAAAKVLASYPAIPTADIYSAAVAHISEQLTNGNVHFTEAGYKRQSDLIVAKVLELMKPSGILDRSNSGSEVSYKQLGNQVVFSIPDLQPNTDVSVNIYSINGALVKNLEGRSSQAQTSQLNWDLRSSNGNGIRSGMYLYQVRSGNEGAATLSKGSIFILPY